MKENLSLVADGNKPSRINPRLHMKSVMRGPDAPLSVVILAVTIVAALIGYAVLLVRS